jgi:hypothetical protein
VIKTFAHYLKDITKRDNDINLFAMDNEIFATQTNTIYENCIITTVFYKSKSK